MFVSILEVGDILMLRSPIFEDLYSLELDFRIFLQPVCLFWFRCHLGFSDAPTHTLYT